ncbi:hypothetical protein B9Z55_000584 [Caenorhabditis nigoni]|uniref:Uncharacterized protein n=1 Tax=Caenorhabditis nigoni TaxID=1611254 RepID=A0A2G5VU56_9PELO|nr:hypothetical protein B9Z55_000584 [Caenorhabditis nigoni]
MTLLVFLMKMNASIHINLYIFSEEFQMKRKVTKGTLNTRTVFSDSENENEAAESENPARKKAKRDNHSYSSDTVSGNPMPDMAFGVPSMYLERNQSPSLWISLPRADKSQLLNFVLEDELIRSLPKRFKVFLTDWLFSIQQKMIKMLTNGYLRQAIESERIECQAYVDRKDHRIFGFLQTVLKIVFKTDKFIIFEDDNCDWFDYIQRMVRKKVLTREVNEEKLENMSMQLNETAKENIYPFFTGNHGNKSEEEARFYFSQILRFFVRFSLNTLRHVFKFDSETCHFYYDEELEKKYLDPVTEKYVKSLQTPKSEIVSIGFNSAIKLGAPLMYLERNESSSLWISFPRAKKSELLKFVLDQKLINVTPGPFKVFLTDWLLSVQHEIIGMLKSDSLRTNLRSAKIKVQEYLHRSEGKLHSFVEEILKLVLEPQSFPIFDEEPLWLEFICKFVGNWSFLKEIDENVLRKSFAPANEYALSDVATFFSGSMQEKNEKANVYYYQILRFALKFALNSIRHVFKMDPKNGYFYHDGELEEVIEENVGAHDSGSGEELSNDDDLEALNQKKVIEELVEELITASLSKHVSFHSTSSVNSKNTTPDSSPEEPNREKNSEEPMEEDQSDSVRNDGQLEEDAKVAEGNGEEHDSESEDLNPEEEEPMEDSENSAEAPEPNPVTLNSYISIKIPFGFPSLYLERNGYSSLWITLPRAHISELLKFILDDELIQVTPVDLKIFLTDWLLSVQQQMIRILKSDELRSNIQWLMINRQDSLESKDDKLSVFLEKILKSVLHTAQFPIFEGGKLISNIRSFIGKKLLERAFDETKLRSASKDLSKAAKNALLAFLLGTTRPKNQQAQNYCYHIYRFVLKFTFNTLRLVFKFDSGSCRFLYDGELEIKGVSNPQTEIVEEMEMESEAVAYDSKVGIISMEQSADVPFDELSMHSDPFEELEVKPPLPILVPFGAPGHEPESHMYPEEAVPTMTSPDVLSSVPNSGPQSIPAPDGLINALGMIIQLNEERFQKLESKIHELEEEIRKERI